MGRYCMMGCNTHNPCRVLQEENEDQTPEAKEDVVRILGSSMKCDVECHPVCICSPRSCDTSECEPCHKECEKRSRGLKDIEGTGNSKAAELEYVLV